jgi:hypothetical protein
LAAAAASAASTAPSHIIEGALPASGGADSRQLKDANMSFVGSQRRDTRMFFTPDHGSSRPAGPGHRPVPMAEMDPSLRPAYERVKKLFLSKRRHSGAARRADPGTQEHLNFQYVRRPVFMGSRLAGSARPPVTRRLAFFTRSCAGGEWESRAATV